MKTKYIEEYTYVIDSQDNIIYVNGEKWDEFYKSNSLAHNCLSSNILKQSLWSFIDDFETKHLYEDILKNVREYKKEITLPFRCDSASKRRFLELTIRPFCMKLYEAQMAEFINEIKK